MSSKDSSPRKVRRSKTNVGQGSFTGTITGKSSPSGMRENGESRQKSTGNKTRTVPLATKTKRSGFGTNRTAGPKLLINSRNAEPESSPKELEIFIADHQRRLKIDRVLLRRVVREILNDHGFRCGQVTVALVSDRTIQRLHRLFLHEDSPTDVLSFPLEKSRKTIEGEIVVSTDTACRQAEEFNTTPSEELLLYVIHGALHLVGFHDHRSADRARMRRAEKRYLRRFGSQLHMRSTSSSGQ